MIVGSISGEDLNRLEAIRVRDARDRRRPLQQAVAVSEENIRALKHLRHDPHVATLVLSLGRTKVARRSSILQPKAVFFIMRYL